MFREEIGYEKMEIVGKKVLFLFLFLFFVFCFLFFVFCFFKKLALEKKKS